MSLAELVLTSVKVEGRTKSEVARDYRVSRNWVHQLVRPYELENETASQPRSKRPHSNPRAVPTAVEERIVRLRKSLGASLTLLPSPGQEWRTAEVHPSDFRSSSAPFGGTARRSPVASPRATTHVAAPRALPGTPRGRWVMLLIHSPCGEPIVATPSRPARRNPGIPLPAIAWSEPAGGSRVVASHSDLARHSQSEQRAAVVTPAARLLHNTSCGLGGKRGRASA